ncbi:MAG: type I-E CRISPR-associated protein Cas5/CasD [Polyangiaceae bacterium]|nr:type I-E CRISPR-associated protein Cas5/CasD [Polyangiaceae bacterium]
MSAVLLRLEGPMQSWGTQSRFGERDTEAEPSKSGVIGLVAAALGVPRDDDARLARLARLSMAVRVDREGTVLCDYHTAGGGRFRGREHGVADRDGDLVGTVLSRRHYLADASFLVALGAADAGLLQEIARGLSCPVWPLSLGRRAFAPSVPVRVPGGLVDADPEVALRAHEYRRPRSDTPARLRLVLECGPSEGRPRSDVPISFRTHDRRYARRFVRTDWVETSSLPLPKEAPCISPDSF